VLRVSIPKPHGRQPPLGIPTVGDRLLQQPCKIVIEPLFEANFQDRSYGFGPKRSAQQAIEGVKEALLPGCWLVDPDIQSCFDTIDQALRLSKVERGISDRPVRKLIRQWLNAGVKENRAWSATEIGSPQGGLISPPCGDYLSAGSGPVLDRTVRLAGETCALCR